MSTDLPPQLSAKQRIQHRVHEIIFEADTRLGKTFDLILLLVIILSLISVSLESIDSIGDKYGSIFKIFEWVVTLLFTLEYAIRLWCVKRPLRYVFSFFGIIDLLSTLPTYLIFIAPGVQGLMVLRALRLLRVFRILHLGPFISEGESLWRAVKTSRAKIAVFLFSVMIIVVIAGGIMYFAEGCMGGNEESFSSIPQSIYWAIVTLTTVGYGDVTPITVVGKILSSIMMLLGYALIVVPTGILSAELVRPTSTQHCPHCMAEGHSHNAKHCHQCGKKIH